VEAAHIILQLFLLLVAAKLAGGLFERLRQPAVLGEILAGIALGPSLLGWLHTNEFLTALAEIGVVFLLFTVGLHTHLAEVIRVGRIALGVGILGAIAPFVLGWGIMAAFGRATIESVFVGAAMMATSVGITARVLADLGALDREASRVIIGAAVIDDIVGLLALAVLSGMAQGGLSYLSVAITAIEAIVFVVFVILIGRRAADHICIVAQRMWTRNPDFIGPVLICLGLSVLAEYVGLAAIVGAFLAGMLFAESGRCVRLEQAVEPLYDLFVPIFFIMIGVQVAARSATAHMLLLAGVVTAAAIVSKLLACRLAAWQLAAREAWIVGVGMTPRGEVGLIVAAIGLSRGVVGADTYGVVVLMSLLTTLFAPSLLRKMISPRPAPGPEHGPPP
jgi:Kef-type K+ transport system membrane component KefB